MALFVPAVVDDAMGLDALALAAALFGLREHRVLGREGVPVDQQSRRPSGGGGDPQIGGALIGRLGAQPGDRRAVGGQLDQPRPGPGEVGIGEYLARA